MMAAKLPDAVSQYIIQNYMSMTDEEMAKSIRTELDYLCTDKSIRAWRHKKKLSKYQGFMREECDWIRDNAVKYKNSVEMALDFEKLFRPITASQLNSKLHYIIPDFKFGHSGGKQKGEGSSVTAKPIGAESKKGGYWWVKIADYPLPKNYTSQERMRNWKQKHYLLWEQVHGPVPKDCELVFLNCNRDDITIENLYCTNKRVVWRMIRNHWFTESREHTLAAIKLCELDILLKGD